MIAYVSVRYTKLMTETSTNYSCEDCKRALCAEDRPCPHCGSGLHNIKINVSETIRVRESFGLRKFAQWSKKFLTHLKQGWFPSGDTAKHPDGVQLIQSIDRENNLYVKRVADDKTGAVAKDVHEPLDKHRHDQYQ